jgi:phage terminase small subunit
MSMPLLKNPRRERFAQLLASGKTATDAHEQAGYRRSDSNASTLARTEEIRGRVEETNRETLERERVTAAAGAEGAAITRLKRTIQARLSRRYTRTSTSHCGSGQA